MLSISVLLNKSCDLFNTILDKVAHSLCNCQINWSLLYLSVPLTYFPPFERKLQDFTFYYKHITVTKDLLLSLPEDRNDIILFSASSWKSKAKGHTSTEYKQSHGIEI